MSVLPRGCRYTRCSTTDGGAGAALGASNNTVVPEGDAGDAIPAMGARRACLMGGRGGAAELGNEGGPENACEPTSEARACLTRGARMQKRRCCLRKDR